MKTILVPINFTLESINGLRTALDIARQTQSQIIMLHNMKGSFSGDAVSDKKPNSDASTYWEDILEEIDFSERIEWLRGLRIQYHVPCMKMDFMVIKDLTKKEFDQLLLSRDVQLIVAGLALDRFKSDFLLEFFPVDETKDNIPILYLAQYFSKLNYRKMLFVDNSMDPDTRLIHLIDSLGSALAMKVYMATMSSKEASYMEDHMHAEQVFIDRDKAGQRLALPHIIDDLQVDLAATRNLLPGESRELDEMQVHRVDRVHRSKRERIPRLL